MGEQWSSCCDFVSRTQATVAICHSKHVCGLSSSVLEIQEEEEEGIGDVDLFSLTPDREHLAVNEKWLRHLQVLFSSPAQPPLHPKSFAFPGILVVHHTKV